MQANPREALAKATADDTDPRSRMISRAGAAHNNQLENLATIIGAVIVAMVTGVPRRNIDAVGILYVALRAVYIWLYVTGENGSWKAPGRSTVWAVCWIACLYLMAHAAYAAPAPGGVGY